MVYNTAVIDLNGNCPWQWKKNMILTMNQQVLDFLWKTEEWEDYSKDGLILQV